MAKQIQLRTRLVRDTLTCKPLDNLNEIKAFLDNPPPWRSLCNALTPHSNFVIRNIEHKNPCEPELELPETYCHFDPDTEEPVRYDITKKKLPKTLVCHDMANGYHDDSKIEGTQHYDAYTFYNWAGIDIFCYFSHHLITIPPVSWISVGHAHGVKVIGTIITEWGQGVHFWDEILSSPGEYRNFASAVVAIAKTMRFDGWLLNIENKITKPNVLLEFLRYLHKILHEELVDPILIWYDSVTLTGHLNWQNGLNAKNKEFFDICDGFFTNYSWTVEDVEESASAAGSRVTDLFIGIDVWGRNFYGGGQFNVQAAVKIAHEAGCSLAIFAPAWTREAISGVSGSNPTMPDYFTTFDEFMLRDRALWDSLWPFLNTRLPCQLPFHTSFCKGLGRKRWMYGEVVSPGPWYNLRHQQYQLNAAHGPHGYVLSSIDRLMKLSYIVKDDKGIIKYRKDLENLRSSTFINNVSEETNQDIGEDTDSSGEIRFVQKRESFIKLQNMPEDGHEEDHETTSYLEPKAVTKSEKKTVTPEKSAQKEQPNAEPKTPTPSKLTIKKLFIDKLKGLFKKRGTKSDISHSSPPEPCCSAKTSHTTESMVKAQSENERADSITNRTEKIAETDGPSVPPPAGHTSMVRMSLKLDLHSDHPKMRWTLGHVAAERECLAMYLEDAFYGGSCIKVNPSDKINIEHRTIRLFHCDFQCQDTLVICVVTKDLVQSSDQYLNIRLAMVNASGANFTVVLMGRSVGLTDSIAKEQKGIVFSYPIDSEQQETFRELREYLLLHEPTFYVPIENLYGWEVRYYEVQVPGSRVTEVNCRTGLPQGGVLLGHFGMCHRVLKIANKS